MTNRLRTTTLHPFGFQSHRTQTGHLCASRIRIPLPSDNTRLPKLSLQVLKSAEKSFKRAFYRQHPPPLPPKASFFLNFSEFAFPPSKYKPRKISVSKCKINTMNVHADIRPLTPEVMGDGRRCASAKLPR